MTITKELIEIIYSAADIQRWNDHVRPQGFTELDKQSHKMIIAFVIAKLEEESGEKVNWTGLIEGSIFEFFHRVMLTDLKPAVFHELMDKMEFELNTWVINKLDKNLKPLGGDIRENIEKYFFDRNYAKKEKRILKAAHYLATNWEFKIIYNLNSMMYGIEKTKEEIEGEISSYYDLAAVKNIMLKKEYYGFLDLCGQLGFQQRWAQLRMMPRISVLGHMYIVAILTYLCLLGKGHSNKRVYNDFFSALFHDLPEVLTRDIINPVKMSIPGLDDIIKDYERRQTGIRIMPLLPARWHEEISYFVHNEFKNNVIIDGKVTELKKIDEKYNSDKYSPLDGEFIEALDKYAAYVEASLAINYGIRSKFLTESRKRLPSLYAKKNLLGFNFGKLFGLFSK